MSETLTKTDFRILAERTFYYIDNLNKDANIYLMLTHDGNKYGVELNTRTAFLGKKLLVKKCNAEILYSTFLISMGRQMFLSDYQGIIDFAFHFRKLKATIFSLLVSNQTLSYEEVPEIKRHIAFTSLNVYDKVDEASFTYPIEIIITLNGDSLSIGSFIKSENKDYTFIFSTDYE